MLITHRFVCALALAACALLSACGFALRGSGPGSTLAFKTIYLGFPSTSTLGTELKRNIIGSGSTEVVSDPKAAEALLDVLAEGRDKQILSLNSQGRVREYTLISRLVFRVRDNKNRELLAPSEIVIRRTLTFNESQVLAKEKEEATLYREMQSDLVQQMMRRLVALKPASA